VHHDVTDEGDWTAAVDAATTAFGRLDILVNNAGIFRWSRLTDTTLDDYMSVVAINQVGTFLGMKAVVPAMTAAGGGSIVNISSIAGLRGSAGTIAYVASKWAVRGMTKVAALELARLGIRVNSIHPGLIDTAMLGEVPGDIDRMVRRVPLGRIASADDVARQALWLASDDSSYTTGAEFVVDGGITAA
jgi:3alpha(or 20beta)-hydroxysteroid dehydrogenase